MSIPSTSPLSTPSISPPQSSGTAPGLPAAKLHVPVQPLPAHPMSFLEAIAREEGFYSAGTRPQRNNNPGDIEYGKFTQAHGAIGGDPRFAIFPDHATGFAAMLALFRCSAYAGLTISAALNKWAPPVENATNAYIGNVCAWTGLHPDTIIDTLFVDTAPVPRAANPSAVTDA
jgi:hypothetical protein